MSENTNVTPTRKARVLMVAASGAMMTFHVKLSDGSYLIAEQTIIGFANVEEEFAAAKTARLLIEALGV